MKKVVLLNYTGSESNWGCQATSSNLLSLIKKRPEISLEYIEIESKVSFYRRILNKIRMILSFLIVHQKFTYFFSEFFKFLHPLERENINKLKNCDILILNGEGSLHGFTSELIKFIQYLSYTSKLDKEIITVNQSLHFDNKKAKKYLKEVYRYSRINFFREPISFENSVLLNIKHSYLVPDAAFLNCNLNSDELYSSSKIPKKYILASGSILLTKESQSFFSLIDKLKNYYKYPVVFLASCEADKELKNLIKQHYNYEYLDNVDVNFEQVQKIMMGAEFFISGRFHMNIFSACVGKLFIPFESNTEKMQGLIDLLDYPLNPLNLSNFDVDQEFKKIQRIIQESEVLERKIFYKSKVLAAKLEQSYENIL